MDFIPPHTHIDISGYDAIVSIGNKCPTAMILRELGLYRESYPFDYIPTTPALVLKYICNNTAFFPHKGVVRTTDGVWFGHFDINEGYEATIATLQRRFQRLYDALTSKKRILFVYTSEADVYNEMGNRYSDNYRDLCKLRDYIKTVYNYGAFRIVAIHTNKTFIDCANITNFTVRVQPEFLSDDMSTHIDAVRQTYRRALTELMRQIFVKKQESD